MRGILEYTAEHLRFAKNLTIEFKSLCLSRLDILAAMRNKNLGKVVEEVIDDNIIPKSDILTRYNIKVLQDGKFATSHNCTAPAYTFDHNICTHTMLELAAQVAMFPVSQALFLNAITKPICHLALKLNHRIGPMVPRVAIITAAAIFFPLTFCTTANAVYYTQKVYQNKRLTFDEHNPKQFDQYVDTYPKALIASFTASVFQIPLWIRCFPHSHSELSFLLVDSCIKQIEQDQYSQQQTQRSL